MPQKINRKTLPKDAFFEKIEKLGEALTFDDVRLRSGYSEVMPDDVNLESKFTKNVPLKIPIVSAAMDTVTEHEMAIGMAKLGGIGVLHKNLDPERQAKEVAKVKFHLNGFIEKPIFVSEDDTIGDIFRRREDKGYTFHTFPVVNLSGKVIGIISKNDFDFCSDLSLTAKEIMTKCVITAKAGIGLKEAYDMMRQAKKKSLPLVNVKGELAGMYTFNDVNRIVSKSQHNYNVDASGQLRVAAAVGVNDFDRAKILIANNVDALVIDTAHGDTASVIKTLKEMKKKFDIDVAVGNISEPDSARRLLEAGADGIKVGQGPGSICTTRIIAGIGSPQVSAIYKCARVADEFNVPVCADGGLKHSGDIPIAIGAGANSVMMGGMLAGTKEAPGEVIFVDGRQWKAYRGMGSIGAMETNKGSRERYGQIATGKNELIAEGVEGMKPYKGDLEAVLFQYVGGLKRGMGYVGAAHINELRDKADFLKITPAGRAESHPHDIHITKEPPNYSAE
jgi:IMP dehydrogenase